MFDRKDYYKDYYAKNKLRFTANSRKYYAKRTKNKDYNPKEYKGRKTYILTKGDKVLYFNTIKSIADTFHIPYGTVRNAIQINKYKTEICGYEADVLFE